jgi:hypothetical protein
MRSNRRRRRSISSRGGNSNSSSSSRRRRRRRRRDRGGAAAGGATSVSSTFKQQINISKYIKLITSHQIFKQQINYLFIKSNQIKSNQIILGSF